MKNLKNVILIFIRLWLRAIFGETFFAKSFTRQNQSWNVCAWTFYGISFSNLGVTWSGKNKNSILFIILTHRFESKITTTKRFKDYANAFYFQFWKFPQGNIWQTFLKGKLILSIFSYISLKITRTNKSQI